jgi:predicted nucleic acid-binding Zn ribbon protein
MRHRAPRPIASAIRSLSEELAPHSPLAGVQTAWTRAAGDQIAAHCVPSGERGGVLTVDCDAAVWAAEMEMRSAELLAALNAAIAPAPTIASLRFRVRGEGSAPGA